MEDDEEEDLLPELIETEMDEVMDDDEFSATHSNDDSVESEEDDDEDDEMEDDEDEAISNLSQITGIDAMEARSYLEMSEWDLSRAIEIYYSSTDHQYQQSEEDDSSERASERVVPTTGFVGRCFGALRKFATSQPGATGVEAARQLSLELEEKLPSRGPGARLRRAFVVQTYKNAAATATRNSKCLLVYLHSPLHQDTDKFCAEVLGSEAVLACVQRHFVVWGAQLSSADGVILSEALRVSHYPFLAVLSTRPDGADVLIDKIQGELDPVVVAERLSRAAEYVEESLEERRRQENIRREDRRLRNEQDREFEESLENDRRKAEAERLEAERLEAEKRRALDEARLAREREEERLLERQRVVERKRARLGDEPESSSTSKKTARIRIQLPNGVKADRRFIVEEHTVQHLRDWVDVYLEDNQVDIEEYALATNYPRRVLTDDILDQTLQQAELGNKVLYVQDINA